MNILIYSLNVIYTLSMFNILFIDYTKVISKKFKVSNLIYYVIKFYPYL